jgi:hypothetical protein
MQLRFPFAVDLLFDCVDYRRRPANLRGRPGNLTDYPAGLKPAAQDFRQRWSNPLGRLQVCC